MAQLPLQIVDLPEARKLESYLTTEPFDLLVVLSWRCLLSREVLQRPTAGTINVHRGALPNYKGARPVQRAIEAGDSTVSITVHRMTEILDEGPIVATVGMDILPLPTNKSAEEYAEKVKMDLYPLYAPLVRLALTSIAASHRSADNSISGK